MLIAFFLQSQELKVIEATSQKWAGGQANSGHGINYRLTIVFNKKIKKLHIDSLWIGNEVFAVKMIKNINNVNDDFFTRYDTLYITARKRVKTDKYGNEIATADKNSKLPIEYQGNALLRYYIKKKVKYFEIKEFNELEPQYYP